MMYKVVHGLVAVPTTHLTATDSRTRANHSYKFRTISCNSTPYKYSLFPRSWNLLPAETAEAIYVRRCIQASSSVVPPFISIGVISLPAVCRLLSRSRSRPYFCAYSDLLTESTCQLVVGLQGRRIKWMTHTTTYSLRCLNAFWPP